MRDLQGTLSGAKQSSAELMATSPYPRHPYKSKPADPLPHPSCPPLLPLELFALAQKNAFRRRLFLWRQEEEAFLGWGKGRGVFSAWGGFLRSMIKPIFVWENWSSASGSELFTDQPVLINSASGALTWQWAGGGGGSCGGFVSRSVWARLLCSGWSGVLSVCTPLNLNSYKPR